MKRLALAITLITSAALLSGCIVVPSRRYHHDYNRYQERGYSQDGHSRGGRDYDGPRR